MAKSLRSKWRRKMKAVKRERYGKKELEKLKLVIEGAKKGASDINMADLQELVNVVPAPERSNNIENEETEEEMEIDRKAKTYNPVTMRDQHGNYPVWMSSHRKKKVVKAQRKQNKIKKKKLKCKLKHK